MTASNFQEILDNPVIIGTIKAIQRVVGYQLSQEDKKPYIYFHNYFTNPQPQFITEWRNDTLKEKWYHRLSNGILLNVQNTDICVQYHFDRLISIEKELLDSIEKYDYKNALGNTLLSPGSTYIWDFEFQAFILALRRCLDFLTKAICNYLKNDFHSFRKFSDYLQKLNRPVFSNPLIEIYKRYASKFTYLLSDGSNKSIRDYITHHRYVEVGCINLSKSGFRLVGGGTDINMSLPQDPILLSDTLWSYLNDFRLFLKDIIFGFVDAMRAEQSSKK